MASGDKHIFNGCGGGGGGVIIFVISSCIHQ